MISQNAQMGSYVPSIARPQVATRHIREESSARSPFRDVLSVIVMILVPVFLIGLANSMNVQAEYRVQGIRRQVMTMAKENAVMKLEVSRLEAPVRVQQIAEAKLGMALPLRAVYGGADPVVPDRNKGR